MSRNRIATAAVMAAAGALALAPTALAKGPSGGGGGGKGGGSGSISAPIDETPHADGLIHYGDWVTFNITTATTQPYVVLTCYQNGTLVLQGKDGFFTGSISGRDFGLWSNAWTGGAATCTAQLETPTWSVLASTSFSVVA
jgi:hypothetical protein